MTFGELVAAIGAAELIVLLLGLAAMLAAGDPPPRLGAPPGARPAPADGRRVKEAA